MTFADLAPGDRLFVDSNTQVYHFAADPVFGPADFFNLPPTSSPGPARDAFSYRITVESEGKQHTVQTQGGSVPSALSPLIERLRQAGHSQEK